MLLSHLNMGTVMVLSWKFLSKRKREILNFDR